MKSDSLDTEELRKLHTAGLSNRQLAAALGVHHSTIARHLAELGVETNSTRNKPLDQISDAEARCRRCREVRPLKEFQLGRKGKKDEYRYAYCNFCRKEQVNQNLNSNIDAFLADRHRRLVLRCKEDGISCNVSRQDYIEQYRLQDGICFYTFRRMVCQVGNGNQPDALSIDRIDPTKGYQKDNFVLCTNQANTIKNNLTLEKVRAWLPFWYERLIGNTKTSFDVVFEVPPDEIKSLFNGSLQTYSKGMVGHVHIFRHDKAVLCHNLGALCYHVRLKTTRGFYHLELDALLSDFNKHKGKQYYVGFEMSEPGEI